MGGATCPGNGGRPADGSYCGGLAEGAEVNELGVSTSRGIYGLEGGGGAGLTAVQEDAFFFWMYSCPPSALGHL